MEPRKDSGEILKQTRVSRGISIETAHEMTKIPMDVLRSIEEGYTLRSLSPFYLKGFIKMYAQYLGVEINKVIIDYPAEEKIPPPMKKEEPQFELGSVLPKKRQQRIVQVAAVILALVLLSRILGCVVSHMKSTKHHKPAVKTEQKQKVQVAKKEIKKSAPAVKKKTADVKPAETVKSQVQPAEPKPERTPSAPVVVSAPEPTAKAPDAKKISLTVRAKKSGWLQVKVDGNLVFQSMLNSGISETWQADDSIELSGKNIQNLDFEVNGKIVGGLGRSDRTTRRVIVNKDGLTVKN